MINKLLGFLIFILLLQVFEAGADTVTVLNPTTMVVTGVTSPGTSFTLGSDLPGSDGGVTEANAAKVYIPMKSNVAVNQEKYFSLYFTENITQLFSIAFPVSGRDYSKYINYPLVVTNTTNETYLYAAVKLADASFRVIAQYSVNKFPVGTTNLTTYFPLSPQSICDQFETSSCLGLISTATTNISNQKFILYFFQSASLIAISDPALPTTTHAGGVYFEAQMSNRIYTNTDLQVTQAPIKVGDGRLILTVSVSTQMAEFKKMLIYNTNGVATAAGLAAGEYTSGSYIDLNIANQSGEITVNKLADGSPLINNSTYYFSALLVDKYKFATSFSASEVGTPLEIEQLLKKQACFLLTAGFGEEHYIITYFRNYRDQVLINSAPGRAFINFYYKTAPKYALMIYKSEILRSIIRGFAYFLYFIFRYLKLLSIGLSLTIIFLTIKRVQKCQ